MEALLTPYEHHGDKPDSARTPHLLCGSRFWPLSSSLGCLYLAWLAYARISSHQFEWPSDIWSILAYAVWVIFLLILMEETQCFRERLLFVILIANFGLGLGMAASPSFHPATALVAREISCSLWVVAAVYSASFIFRGIPVLANPIRKP